MKFHGDLKILDRNNLKLQLENNASINMLYIQNKLTEYTQLDGVNAFHKKIDP